jgi:hypothetical protein
MRYQLGWYFIGVALSNIIINWLIIVSRVIKLLILSIEHNFVKKKIKKTSKS